MRRLLLVLVPAVVVTAIGVLLLYVTDSPGTSSGRGAEDPNAGFLLPGKTGFPLRYEGERMEYAFEGREGSGSRKTVYDASNWFLTLFPQDESRARFVVTEGSVETLTGYRLEDGLFRVDRYAGSQGEPREFWQTLFNILFFLPRNRAELEAPRMREFAFPSREEHLVTGTALFRHEGEHRLGGRTVQALGSDIRLDVLTRSGRDVLTQFLAEGLLYYDAEARRIRAGEFEWAAGRVDQIYSLGGQWNYLLYYEPGFRPAERRRDYISLSANLTWALRRKTGDAAYSRKAFENGARNLLYNIAEAQERFREAALVDQDGDGKGEYGLLPEVAGATSKLRADGGLREWPVDHPDLRLRATYGKVDSRGVSQAVDGYRFLLFLRSARGLLTGGEPRPGRAEDADLQETRGAWCAYAWPDEPGPLGRKVFFTRGGKVWATENPPFRPGEEIPSPRTTERPEGPDWTFEPKGMVYRPDYELVTLSGEKIEGEARDLLLDILAGQNEMTLFHQDKALRPEHHYLGIFLTRDILKTRQDGRLTLEEIRPLHARMGALLRDIHLGLASSMLAEAEGRALDGDAAPGFVQGLADLRERIEAMEKEPPDARRSREMLNRVRTYLSRGRVGETPDGD